MAEITAGDIRALADADYGQHLAVLSRSDDGEARIEAESTARDNGRIIVADGTWIQDWSDGEPMTDADCAQLAADLNRDLAERA